MTTLPTARTGIGKSWLNCGAYSITLEGETGELMGEYLPERGTAEELEQVNVLRHVNSGFPPVFLMTCTGDFLAKDVCRMAEKLTQCQVPFVYRFYGDKAHTLGHVFHCNMKSEAARRCNDDECAFFRQLCGEG